MSTSLLYHGFGISGYRYIRTDYREGDVISTISRKKFSIRCPVCKSKNIIKHGVLPRWLRCLPIGKKATYMKTEVHRVECRDCKAIRQSDIGFADVAQPFSIFQLYRQGSGNRSRRNLHRVVSGSSRTAPG
jgi:transposase